MTASVIPFPAPRFARSDITELLRWSAEAAVVAGWWVWADPLTDVIVERANNGLEYVSLAQGQPWDGCAYTIERRHTGWVLVDARSDPVGTFSTLREALEAVCRTISDSRATA